MYLMNLNGTTYRMDVIDMLPKQGPKPSQYDYLHVYT